MDKLGRLCSGGPYGFGSAQFEHAQGRSLVGGATKLIHSEKKTNENSCFVSCELPWMWSCVCGVIVCRGEREMRPNAPVVGELEGHLHKCVRTQLVLLGNVYPEVGKQKHSDVKVVHHPDDTRVVSHTSGTHGVGTEPVL